MLYSNLYYNKKGLQWEKNNIIPNLHHSIHFLLLLSPVLLG